MPGASTREKTLAMPLIDCPGLQPESFVRNNRISSASFSRSSSSPNSSPREVTPTSSYGSSTSYESYPWSGYPASRASTGAARPTIWTSSSSPTANISTSSLDLPPTSTSKCVYHDTLAAQATAAAPRQRGATPPSAPTPYYLGKTTGERKGSLSLCSKARGA